MMQKAQPALQPSCTFRLARVRPSAAGVADGRRAADGAAALCTGSSADGARGTGKEDAPGRTASTAGADAAVPAPAADDAATLLGGPGSNGSVHSRARLVQLVRVERARSTSSTRRSFWALGTMSTLPGRMLSRP